MKFSKLRLVCMAMIGAGGIWLTSPTQAAAQAQCNSWTYCASSCPSGGGLCWAMPTGCSGAVTSCTWDLVGMCGFSGGYAVTCTYYYA